MSQNRGFQQPAAPPDGNLSSSSQQGLASFLHPTSSNGNSFTTSIGLSSFLLNPPSQHVSASHRGPLHISSATAPSIHPIAISASPLSAASSQQLPSSSSSLPSLLTTPFPTATIHTSIPPTHFLTGMPPTSSSNSSNINTDLMSKKRKTPSATSRAAINDDDDEEDDDTHKIEIDDTADETTSEFTPTKAMNTLNEMTSTPQSDVKRRKGSDGTTSSVTTTASNTQKGCNCKKTGCLKRYCECFQNNKRCTDKCRCQGCKNYDGCADLCRVLEKQSKSGTSSTASNQRKVNSQKRKQTQSQTSSSSSMGSGVTSANTSSRQQSSQIGSPSILGGGGIIMAHGTVPSFAHPYQHPPMNTDQISASLYQHPLSCLFGEESVVELCKRLVIASVQQEQIFKDEWASKSSDTASGGSLLSPALTSPKNSSKSNTDNFLLCDEDDATNSAMNLNQAQALQSPRKVYPKGFENGLINSINTRVVQEFKHFLTQQPYNQQTADQQE
ncbi:hypothetical protein C9374_009320 [Naegleria lovaniensis]|uniref:CRC domain-containing protein n=1 Tax=Naegleria lovaniensis TaxID=51637 RepID=A0AA88GDH4_NAELO|nr:uncharacterized protein C9374_009320 [Naegleria lovaniensis]KAG2377409.1 hypothetical protein C9374_009320 [Naegleria lovaniensis]